MSADEYLQVFKTRGPLDPVTDHAVCVQRPELDQLLRAAQAPAIDAYLAVLSSRQTGKTTLLYQLRARLRPRGYAVVLIDLAVTRNQAEAELYRYVASEIRSALDLSVPRHPGRRVAAPPCNPIEFRTFLLDTARQSAAPRIVIMIDEVEAISGKASDGFFGTVRNVFSSRRKEDESAFEKYLFVLSGSKELHRLSTGPNSPLNIAERVYLEDFTLEGVQALVANFTRAAIAAPPETARWIYAQTTGHPYLTQKLCSQIEQWHPGVITQEIVQRATIQILKSDDHLEKMLQQIDEDRPVRQTLEEVVSGKQIAFSRLQPAMARLELLGAIRDSGNCAVRNPIYYAAFSSHFNVKQPPTGARRWMSRWRLFVLIGTLLFMALNLPFLYNYLSDFYWKPSSVNEKFAFVTPNSTSNFTVHYDRILRANSPNTANISVDWDGIPLNGGVDVMFQADHTDIVLQGPAQRSIDQPYQQVRFAFELNQSGSPILKYNPFSPGSDHRQVRLTFTPSGGSTRQVYTADFVVDYYSAFVVSAVLSLASFIGALAAIFGKVRYVQQLLRVVARYASQPS